MRMALVGVVALGACLTSAPSAAASGVPRDWEACSKDRGHAAAVQAGLVGAFGREPRLRRLGVSASLYRRPATSLCGDVDGDGRIERAVLYQCCTVSSPAPWLVLRQRGGRWRIAFKRLSDVTFRLEGDGATLVSTEPKYGPGDSNCCPSNLKVGRLRWDGRRFVRTFALEAAEQPQDESS